MCGLFGMHTDYMTDEEAARVYGLGFLSMARGTDSSGVAVAQAIKNRLRTRERKDIIPMHQFLAKDNIKSLIFDNRTRCVVGHARAATIGNVTTHNAHPIHEEHIIGTHNGTVDQFKPNKDMENISSDSRVFFRKIATEGLDEACKQANDRDGAFAIVYIDVGDQTLNIVRNFKRPLYLLQSKHHGVFYWASEEKMLELIIKNDSTNLFEKPCFVKPETHYSIKIGESVELTQREITAMKKVIHTTPKVSLPFNSNNSKRPKEIKIHEPPWKAGWESELQDFDDFLNNLASAGDDNAPKSEVMYKAGEHGYIDLYSARNLLAGGCAFCSAPLDLGDEVYWFVTAKEYVCRSCVDDPFVRQYGELDKHRCKGKLVRKHHQVECH